MFPPGWCRALETVSFVEGDILRICRFKISEFAVAVAGNQRVAHQRRAQSFTLVNRVDTMSGKYQCGSLG